jgi:D-arabinonate dehydratase/D-galactarolactone cycloisomerase
VVEAHGVELVPHQTQPTIGHTANLHLVASLLHLTKPCEWNDTTPRQHSVFENPPNQPAACSTYRPDPVSVYKSTRPN